MAKKLTTKPAPAIIAEELSPYGDVGDVQLPTGVRDPSWVEGYSDKRREYDMALAAGERPAPMPYRLQYVNRTRATGQPDNSKVAEFAAKGYVLVDFDSCKEQYGIDPDKSGFVRTSDGKCGLGDQVIMAAPREVAAFHARAQRDDTRALSEGVSGKLEQAVADYNARNPSSTPTSIIREESVHKR